MTVYKRGGVYQYDFRFKGQRHKGSTQQLTRDDAEQVEHELKKQLRQQAAGVAPAQAKHTPAFSDWAEIYLAQKARELRSPEDLERVLAVVLRFFGRRPKAPAPGEPYHDLRLGDLVVDPFWIERFERWMADRGVSGSTRNHYRSAVSGMYRLASAPTFRMRTQIFVNPMAGIWRDPPVNREVALSIGQLRAWIAAASYHARLAVAIGALAPKLRLQNILDLRWGRDVDEELRWITVQRHKTRQRTGRPLVIPVSAQLRQILIDAQARQGGRAVPGAHVVQYRGRAVKSIRGSVQNAAIEAGLPYGLKALGGVTFHSLRHTAATFMAELGLPEKKRQEVMGHSSIHTTQKYTHLKPVHLEESVEQLSAAVPIADLVTAPRLRAARRASITLKGGAAIRGNLKESGGAPSDGGRGAGVKTGGTLPATPADSRLLPPTLAKGPASTKVH